MSEEQNKSFTFIVSDESVNKYGYRVLTEGIDLTEFEKNPVMLFNHHRSDDYTGNTNLLPVGKWSNIRIDEENRLLMDAIIDDTDDLGKKMISKISQGMLNAASIGIGVVELSEDPELLLAGQSRPTIKKSVLQEVSIVDIPANKNAMRLNFAGTILNLSLSEDMKKLNAELPEIEKIGEYFKKFIETLGAALGGRIEELVSAYAEANEMTLEEVREAAGNAAGISSSTIAQIEDGQINCPPVERLEGLSEFFGVSLNSLLELAASDGCEYELKEEKEEEENIDIKEEELRNNFSSALFSFIQELKNSYKIVKKDNTPSGKLSEMISKLKADLISFDSKKEEEHSEELEEISSTVEILKAELDLMKDKVSGNENTIESLKKANLKLISKGTVKTPAKEEAPITENKEELKEKTKLERQYEAFDTLGKKYFKKKKS